MEEAEEEEEEEEEGGLGGLGAVPAVSSQPTEKKQWRVKERKRYVEVEIDR